MSNDDISALTTILSTLLSGTPLLFAIVKSKQGKKKKIRKAVKAIQKAIVATRRFIDDVGYEPNILLSNLWIEAFDKLKEANVYAERDFPDYLYNKARFWGDPKLWLREQGAMELVPSLDELEKQCASLLIKTK